MSAIVDDDDFTRRWSPAHDVCFFRDLVTMDVFQRTKAEIETAGSLSAICRELRKLRPRKVPRVPTAKTG